MYRQVDHNLIEQMLVYFSVSDNEANDEKYETARQIKVFLDEIPGGFLIYHADGDEKLIYANKALIKMFRCDSYAQFKELTGNSFKGVVYHEDLERVEKSIKEQIAASSDDLDYVEYRIIGKDGVVRWVEDYGHFVHTESVGDIFYVFISEATEKINRRNSERAALINAKNEKEQKLQNLIEEYDKERKLIRQEHLQRLEVIEGLSINYDSILYIDLDEDMVLPYRLSCRIEQQFDNKLHKRCYSEFADEFIKAWVHPDDREMMSKMLTKDYIRKTLADNRTFYHNFRCIKNGETQFLQMRLVDVGNGGQVSQVVMGNRNIDKEVLQEMKQKQLLEEALKSANLANVAKNTFLSNMSHDMRTPLNAIVGYTALAHKNIDDKKAVESYLAKIDNAGKEILNLVEKVLEVSYMESQDFKIIESECDIKNIANDVILEIRPDAIKKDIEVSLSLDKVEHSAVFTDEEKLKLLLHHIAGNAVKFTGNGGKIQFIVEEQKSASNEYATFRFIMKDTGVGISKENLQRIFEPFERERNTTHSGVYGSGLGLTISKYIIEMMGGTINAESTVNRGSTFTVTLSLRVKDGFASDEEIDCFTDKIKNKKMLLVEDNEINREIETEMLEDVGFIVDTAENGKIAIEKVEASKPGEYLFVLMDIQMPVMDGRKSSEEIRKLKNPLHAQIPIIALSANAFESDKRISISTGIDEHLNKPIDIPVLLQTLKKVLVSRNKEI